MPWPAETAIDFSASGDNAVVAAVAGQSVQVYQIFFVVSADTIITFYDGVGGTALTGPISMKANGSVVLDFVRGSREADQPWFRTTEGNAFIINQSGTAQVSGRVYYRQGQNP